MKNENNSKYFSLIKYGIENIGEIQGLEKITSNFKDSIENITEETRKQYASMSYAMGWDLYPGQKNFVFKFNENNIFFGELELDYLPVNIDNLLKNELGEIKTSTWLANYRVQLFCNGLFPRIQLKRRFKEILGYIIKLYGLPNSSTESISQANILYQNFNIETNCWFLKEKDGRYAISLYFSKKPKPFISFSISIADLNN
ncbi:MAG: hypothetical protein WDK96_00105 [Candidatus Paceibacterota bacterium]|jgi:hypothetical protein